MVSPKVISSIVHVLYSQPRNIMPFFTLILSSQGKHVSSSESVGVGVKCGGRDLTP